MGARGGPAEVSPAMTASVMPAGSPHYEGLLDPNGPVVPGEEVLPVLPALRGLLAGGGVQRGHVAAVAGGAWRRCWLPATSPCPPPPPGPPPSGGAGGRPRPAASGACSWSRGS